MAVKTRSVDALFRSMDYRFPNRDRTSDGWIGDAAHRLSTSGHNPDESGKAEFTDADNVDEVRAGDLDADLRDPDGVTMAAVMDAIRMDPVDRDRVYYLIYNGRQCSARTRWLWVPYYGSNDHSKHGHVSTWPAADNDGRPWRSVETVGGAVAQTDAQQILEELEALRLRVARVPVEVWLQTVEAQGAANAWFGGENPNTEQALKMAMYALAGTENLAVKVDALAADVAAIKAAVVPEVPEPAPAPE